MTQKKHFLVHVVSSGVVVGVDLPPRLVPGKNTTPVQLVKEQAGWEHQLLAIQNVVIVTVQDKCINVTAVVSAKDVGMCTNSRIIAKP